MNCYKCGSQEIRKVRRINIKGKDYFYPICGECNRKRNKKNNYSKTQIQARKIWNRVHSNKYRKKNWKDGRIKSYAHLAVFKAIKSGILKRHSCEICGNHRSQGHHKDYSKPLDVIWLCKLHHMQADMKRREVEKSVEIVGKR